MEERRICCCGAKTWTRIIGWISTLAYLVVAVFGLVTMLARLPNSSLADAVTDSKTMTELYQIDLYGLQEASKYKLAVTFLIICGLDLGFGFITSALLLFATYSCRPNWLVPWLVFNVLSGTLHILCEIRYALSSEPAAIIGVVAMSVMTVSYIFMVWVVGTHHEEMTQKIDLSHRDEDREEVKTTTFASTVTHHGS